MIRYCSFITTFLIITSVKGQDINIHNYTYEQLNIDLKKDYNDAEFIADYYFTEGISLGARYYYEILVIDSVISLIFDAPGFDCYNYVKYVKRFQLEPEDLDSLKKIINKAGLKQTHEGIAHWEGSMYTREILVIKSDTLFIAGGQTYMPEAKYPEYINEDEARKAIEKDKRDSSSISGDYDSIVNFLNKYFTNLSDLLLEAKKYD